ncbi:MAG: hypothetical protein ACRC5M_05240 [Anaeroplasmataceae bacterium]
MKKYKLVLGVGSLLACIISVSVFASNFINYRKYSTELDRIITKINQPLNNENAISDPGAIEEVLKGIPNKESISTILELDSTTYEIVNRLDLEELDSISSNALLEIVITSNNVLEDLKYLGTKLLVYEYISVVDNSIKIKLSTKGGN